MYNDSTSIRIKRKTISRLVAVLIALVVVTPVLADYLGPNRTVTETQASCTVVLLECQYVPSKDIYKYRRVDSWSCSNEGKPWRDYDSSGPACEMWSEGRMHWERQYSTETTSVTYPEATITGVLQNCALNNGWCVTAPSLELTANEPVSGYSILAVEGSLNGEGFACPEADCSVPLREGDNSFTFWALSSWGDSSTMGTLTALVDTVSPDLGLDVSGSNGARGWYVSPVTITATGADSVSGLAGTFLSVDGGVWQASATLNDGVHNIALSASDNAGNVSNSSTMISVDTTTPSLYLSISGTAGVNGWYVSNLEVSATASDATSGISSFEYSADGSPYQPYTSSTLFTDGRHTIQFKAVDNAGNLTETPLQEFHLDSIGPFIEIPSSSPLGETIRYKVQDDGSGLASLRVVIEDEDERFAKIAWNEEVSGAKFSGEIEWDGKFKDGTVAPPGTYLVWIKSSDLAGNGSIGLGQVIVPEPDSLFNLFQTSNAPTEIPLPPDELDEPENSSAAIPSSNPSFGGAISQSTAAETQSILLATGKASSSPDTSSNILWGAAAAAMIGTATAYALEERRKRKEEEARQAAEVEAKVEARNAAVQASQLAQREALKMEGWLEGQALRDAQMEEARRLQLEQADMTQAERLALHKASPEYQAYQQRLQDWEEKQEKIRAIERAEMTQTERLAAYKATPEYRDYEERIRAWESEQAYQDWRADERIPDSHRVSNWWEKTKFFVTEKIIEPVDTYIYQPFIVPAMDTTKELVTSGVSWIDENVYQPYITPAVEQAKQALSTGSEWVNENIYQPYVAPAVEQAKRRLSDDIAWVNEHLYQPYVKPAVEKSIEVAKDAALWLKENVYQPYIEPALEKSVEAITDGISWLNTEVYQPYIQPLLTFVNEEIYQPYVEPFLDKTKEAVGDWTSWIDENIYQPTIGPIVSDIDRYIFQPYFKPLMDEAKAWWQNTWDQYGEWVHGSLDAAGFIPGLGEIADGLNGLIYLGEGRYVEASVSALAMIPLLGDLGKAGKWTVKVGQEVVEEVAEKVAKEAAEELAEKIVNESLEEVAEKTIQESAEELLEQTAKETLEETAEKTLKESGEELASKVVRETLEGASEKVLKETGEELAEKAVKEVVEKTTKDVASESVTKAAKDTAAAVPAISAKKVSKTVAGETVEETLEQASEETAQLISSLTEKYGDDMVARFLPLCEKYGINPHDVLTRPPTEGQSLIGWVLGIKNPANPVNHPLVSLKLTDADLKNILKQSVVRPNSKIVVLGYGGGCKKPYYMLSDEIGGCHLSLSNDAWAPFDNARANFWADVNAPFLDKAIEERKIFLFNVNKGTMIDPANVERFSLPEMKLIEIPGNNYVRVEFGQYELYVPQELEGSYLEYLPESLLGELK